MMKLVLLLTISLVAGSCYATQEPQDPSDEDVEETSELVVNYLGPLLEVNGFTLADLPNHLKYLTSKYYLIFSRGVEPLDTLERMVSDCKIIEKSQHIASEVSEKQLSHFIELNTANKAKSLKKFVSKMLEKFDFDLQVVRPRDAVAFLLYQEAYPDIMNIISRMVNKHYDAYLNERAKQASSDGTDKSQSYQSNDSDDIDFGALLRVFVASNGRLELLKRMMDHFEQFVPPVDKSDMSESVLDYLDDLYESLSSQINRAWIFIRAASYTSITYGWIETGEEILGDLFSFFPINEIENFFDAIILNANDRRALIILITDYWQRRSATDSNVEDGSSSRSNAGGVFGHIFTTVYDIVGELSLGLKNKVQREAILKHIDKLLSSYEMTRDNLSDKMTSIITQIPSASNKEVLEADVMPFRENFIKLRNAIGALTPEQTESNHIELQTLLQSIVNKFGPLVFEMEKELKKIRAKFQGNFDGKQIFLEEDIAEVLENFVKKIGKNSPSKVVRERLMELWEFIDAFFSLSHF